jgi:hypothetical protein
LSLGNDDGALLEMTENFCLAAQEFSDEGCGDFGTQSLWGDKKVRGNLTRWGGAFIIYENIFIIVLTYYEYSTF